MYNLYSVRDLFPGIYFRGEAARLCLSSDRRLRITLTGANTVLIADTSTHAESIP